MNTITEKAPGKIMITGEWSIMQPGNWCLVAAIDQYIYATITEHATFRMHLKDFNILGDGSFEQGSFKFSLNETKHAFVQEAISISLGYTQEHDIALRPFFLTVNADQYLATRVKYGLGSSAAVTVAVIKVVLSFYGVSFNAEVIFKLAAIAHLKAQNGKGSCFDIAASSFMTTVAYSSFDRAWLIDKLAHNISLTQLINLQWPLLEIIPCSTPKDLYLCIGWTRHTAVTTALIDVVSAWQHSNPAAWSSLAQKINDTACKLIDAYKNNDTTAIQALIAHNRSLLSLFSQYTRVQLETAKLKTLIEIAEHHGACAKFSGAGGGDCGIAVCTTAQTAYNIKEAWQQQGIEPLKVNSL